MLDIKDLALTPFFLLVVYLIMFIIRRSVTSRETRRYFIPAFTVKVIGAVSLGLIYFFYYGSGDTLLFFNDASRIMQSLSLDPTPVPALKMIFFPNVYDPETHFYTSRIYYYYDTPTYFIVRICAFFSLFTFHTYTINAILFACVSFIGNWCMFKVFIHLYPNMVRPMAIAVFFVPSVFFWGSGLLKDSITLGALGLSLYGFYFGIIRGKKRVANVLVTLLGLWLIQSIKVFILYCFLPVLMLWLYLHFNSRIRSAALRLLLTPMLFIMVAGLSYMAVVRITVDTDYSVEKLAKKSKVTADYLRNISNEGSYYEIGQFDGSLQSIVVNLPKALMVTLFRPFLWEARNPLMLLSGLEAAYFLWITFKVFRYIRLRKLISTIGKEHLVFVALVFTVAFSFAVGTATSNFGSLVRYKIPIIPFYMMAMLVIYEKNRPAKPSGRLVKKITR